MKGSLFDTGHGLRSESSGWTSVGENSCNDPKNPLQEGIISAWSLTSDPALSLPLTTDLDLTHKQDGSDSNLANPDEGGLDADEPSCRPA